MKQVEEILDEIDKVVASIPIQEETIKSLSKSNKKELEWRRIGLKESSSYIDALLWTMDATTMYNRLKHIANVTESEYKDIIHIPIIGAKNKMFKITNNRTGLVYRYIVLSGVLMPCSIASREAYNDNIIIY